MCVTSMVTPAFQPVIPQPTWDWWIQPKQPAWQPLSNGRTLTPEDLKGILDAFKAAQEAAAKADKLAGQPDCEDPEKVQLRERVRELKARLAKIQEMSK